MYSTSNLFQRREILIEHAFTSTKLFVFMMEPSIACLSQGIIKMKKQCDVLLWLV